VQALLQANVDVRFMRDVTRGGLASVLIETAVASQRTLAIEESAVCVSSGVAAACELTGLDPWHLACEGRFIAVVAERDRDRAVATLRAVDQRNDPRIIGRVESDREGRVRCRGIYGSTRPLVMASGELLPRIC
jgi:hydrogenase expression/formation protein HypE